MGILRTKREFIKTANTSVAIGTEETIFDESFKGSIRTLSMFLDWNNETAGDSVDETELTITIDGVVVMDGALLIDLFEHFCAKNVNLSDSIIRFAEFDNSVEKRVSFQIDLQSLVETGVKVELKNVSGTHAVSIKSGLIYDH